MNHKLIWGVLLLLVLAVTFPTTTAEIANASWQSTTEWQPLGGPYGGSAAALAISPGYTTDHTLFAGLRGQGIYRAYSDVDNWQAISPPWHVVDLAISPDYVNDKTLFALSGLWTTGYTVHRSTDRGNTWQTASPATFSDALGLAISPNFTNDHTLYLYSSSTPGYISSDGGATFNPLSGWFTTHQANFLTFSPDFANDHTLFALVPFEGLYQSTDGGTVWALTSLTGSYTTLAVSPNFASDQILIATDTIGQLHRSADGGTTWTTPPLILGAGGQHTLRFSPTFATDQVILAASSTDPGPYRSADGGLTWAEAGWYDPVMSFQDGMIGGSVFDLALVPNQDWSGTVYAATSIGVARSAYSGNGWYQRNNGLAALTVRSITAAPGNPDVLLAGTSYHENMRFDTGTPGEYDGSLQYSYNGGHDWKAVSGRLDRVKVVVFSPDFANDETAFAAAGMIGQHGYADGGVYRSTNGGYDWTEVLGNLAAQALAVSPDFTNDQTVWTAVSNYSTSLGIYRSQDGGTTWTPLASGVNAQSIVPSPNFAADQTLFAGTPTSGLQKSEDGGVTWTPLATPAMITALAVSPAYGASQTLVIGAQADVNSPGAIYCSTDGGTTWDELATGIPTSQNGHNLTIATLEFASDGSILAGVQYGGTDGAVYRSADGGGMWTAVATGLEDTQPFDLMTLPSGSFTIFAGVEGGLRQIEIEQDSPTEPGTWYSSGPRGGSAQALAVSPNFAIDGVAFSGNWRVTYQGGDAGIGFVKSTDGGQTWAIKPDSSESLYNGTAVHGYALSPNFPSDGIGFAATGGGVYQTSDGGETWHWLGDPDAPPGWLGPIAIAPNFSSSGHIMTGASYYSDVLYLSQDGGQTWTTDAAPSASAAIAYSPNFASDQTAFTAGMGVFKTENAGLTWTEVLTGAMRSLAVSPNFATDSTLFAGGWGDFYISDNGGSSWITRTIATGINTIDALSISPQFASDQTLFAGTNIGLFWSEDGGDSWQAVSEYAGTAVAALAVSPNWPTDPTLLVGTATGVYRLLSSDPSTGIVREATAGFAPLDIVPLALANDENLLLSGATYYGMYGSQDNGQSWQPAGFNGNGYYAFADVAISPNYHNDQTFFAARSSMLSIGGSIYRTTDGGATWTYVYGTDYVSSLAISPDFANDQTIIAGTNEQAARISTDGGDTWSKLGEWPFSISDRGAALYVALPPDYPADGTVFAGGYKGLWRLPVGETMWQSIDLGLAESYGVTAVTLSPAYTSDQTILVIASWSDPVTYENYASPYLSTDGGATWTPGNIGLPDSGLTDIALSPYFAIDHTVYGLTGTELYRSRDGGLSWTMIGAAPGQPTFHDLQVNRQGTVFVSTSRGIWQYDTAALDILINGRFEANSGWEMLVTRYQAGYTDDVVFDGRQAVQIGITNDVNKLAYSSARQSVTLPTNTITATLSFQLYPVSGEATPASQEQLFPAAGLAQPTSTAAGDAQYGLVLDPVSGEILDTIFWQLSNGQEWQTHTFDLSGYAGQTILLHFGVYNDGLGGVTAVYLDNAALVIQQTDIWANKVFLPVILK
ncbi:MAG: hypothetical protein H6667_11540 [Ardenticatenaceae bacterium]|nr:hypothetical protein [Ardenticatenaceae bacterium]